MWPKTANMSTKITEYIKKCPINTNKCQFILINYVLIENITIIEIKKEVYKGMWGEQNRDITFYCDN